VQYAQLVKDGIESRYMVYAKIECKALDISVIKGNPAATKFPREQIGNFIVCFDLLCMAVFLFIFWYL
jgi:hypothetical protein